MNVSILIVTYNHEKYIQECLESVRFQVEKYNKNREHNVQIVVSDDHSTDFTRDVARRWNEKRGDIIDDFQIIGSNVNEGTCRNYLKGLRACTGEYIKPIGGDDLFGKHSIFEMLKYLNEYDIVYGLPLAYIEGGENDPVRINDDLKKVHYIYQEESSMSYYDLIHRYCFLNAPGTCLRKELQVNEDNVKMLLNYRFVDDYSQYIKISEIKEIRRKYIPEIVIIYRRTNDSTYMRANKHLKEELISIFHYARKTSHRLREKIIQTSSIYMQKRKNPIKCFDILAYIHKFYIFIHRKDDSVDYLSDIKEQLEYVENIKLIEK